MGLILVGEMRLLGGSWDFATTYRWLYIFIAGVAHVRPVGGTASRVASLVHSTSSGTKSK